MAMKKPTAVRGGQGITAYAGGDYGRMAAKSKQPVSKSTQTPTAARGGQGITAFAGGEYGRAAGKSRQPVARTAEATPVPVKPKPKPVQVVKTTVSERLTPVKKVAAAKKSPTAFQAMNARVAARDVYSGTKTASGLNARPGFKTIKDIFRKKGK